MADTEERLARLRAGDEAAAEEMVPAALKNGAGDVPAGSLIDQLVQQREEIAQDTTSDFEVPNNGNPGVLWVTYRLLPWREIRRIADLATSRKQDAELRASCEMLSRACVEVWLRDPESGERRPWPGRDADLPLRFEPELLRLLRIEAPAGNLGAREIMGLVFQRDLAITAHHLRVQRWMEGAQDDVNEAFAGG